MPIGRPRRSFGPLGRQRAQQDVWARDGQPVNRPFPSCTALLKAYKRSAQRHRSGGQPVTVLRRRSKAALQPPIHLESIPQLLARLQLPVCKGAQGSRVRSGIVYCRSALCLVAGSCGWLRCARRRRSRQSRDGQHGAECCPAAAHCGVGSLGAASVPATAAQDAHPGSAHSFVGQCRARLSLLYRPQPPGAGCISVHPPLFIIPVSLSLPQPSRGTERKVLQLLVREPRVEPGKGTCISHIGVR